VWKMHVLHVSENNLRGWSDLAEEVTTLNNKEVSVVWMLKIDITMDLVQ
jgi:hypothetical protein